MRLQRHVPADQLDHYRLILKTDGALHCETNAERQVIQPGGILLHDLARPAQFDFTAGANVVLVVPREMLDEAVPFAVDLHGVRLRGTAANLLGANLLELVLSSPQVEAVQGTMVTQAILSLLAASIMPSVHTLARASEATESTLLRQMCRYVDLHLDEPDLSAGLIAGFFSVSRPRLYRLFEALGGVANFIKERRLARVHAPLSQPPGRVLIGRLAKDHGF